MKWTDRIRQVKIALVVAAVLIAVVSLLVSNSLAHDLAKEERNKMETWAEAMRSLSIADDKTDLNLVLKVINENHTIPVIVTDADGRAQTFRNVDLKGRNHEDSLRSASEIAKRMLNKGKVIKIALDDSTTTDYINVCYADSVMLRRLSAWPYVQLGVVMLFVVVAIFALLTSKKAEQNKVWVGLSKETAHQLGTPVSSLMAWIEILKETYPQDELPTEMEQDVHRLELITERFSKIGANPETVKTNLNTTLEHVLDYMNRRTSSQVVFTKDLPEPPLTANINAALFEWVIENLCKNAVDAMDGHGTISLRAAHESGKTVIEIADTGKGIRKKDLRNVFRPGFTTKKRGWGLGLSLAKRIVEEYHHGRIYVKSSEPNVGTCFRIELI